eukprot:TRINITY_DN8574_c0_g1_i1.p1 TRINITY_DN8574_c0_g1~~TRINITY_DN8574_c0_g1_i1.p1  ORF type:complete len:470 (-),score=105.96 TRINITY_DN8574_c0_g1_i1:92-1408(-)
MASLFGTTLKANNTKDLTHEGWLTKVGRESGKWQRRYFISKGKSISYYENQGGSPKSRFFIDEKSKIVPSIEAGETVLPELACTKSLKGGAPDHCFAVEVNWKNSRRNYILAAETAEEKNDWINYLDKVIAGAKLDVGDREAHRYANQSDFGLGEATQKTEAVAEGINQSNAGDGSQGAGHNTEGSGQGQKAGNMLGNILSGDSPSGQTQGPQTHQPPSAQAPSTQAPQGGVLPEGWGSQQDEHGRTFYIHYASGQTHWQPPQPVTNQPQGAVAGVESVFQSASNTNLNTHQQGSNAGPQQTPQYQEKQDTYKQQQQAHQQSDQYAQAQAPQASTTGAGGPRPGNAQVGEQTGDTLNRAGKGIGNFLGGFGGGMDKGVKEGQGAGPQDPNPQTSSGAGNAGASLGRAFGGFAGSVDKGIKNNQSNQSGGGAAPDASTN